MKFIATCTTLLLTCTLLSQKLVTETNLRVSSSESLFYGFDAGDQFTLTMTTEDGKDLKEVEISRYPNMSKYKDFKVSEVNKTITVSERGFYEFRFKNGLKKRICNIKITKTGNTNFNSEVVWKTVTDTIKYKAQEKYLISADTSISTVYDQEFTLAKGLGSTTASKKIVNFTIPANTESWSFLIGSKNEVELAQAFSNLKMAHENPDSVRRHPQYTCLTWTSLGYPRLFDNRLGDMNLNYYILKSGTDATGFLNNTTYNQTQSGFGSVMMEKSRTISSIASNANYIPAIPTSMAIQNANSDASSTIKLVVEALIIKKNYGSREVEKMRFNTYKKPFHVD